MNEVKEKIIKKTNKLLDFAINRHEALSLETEKVIAETIYEYVCAYEKLSDNQKGNKNE